MDARNNKERKNAIISFSLGMIGTLLFLCAMGILMLKTAEKGIESLVDKKNKYDEVFRQQGTYNSQIDDMRKKIASLREKGKTENEYRQLQSIITQERMKIGEDIYMSGEDSLSYSIYSIFLNQIQGMQENLDKLDAAAREREYRLEQIQKGKKILND